MSVIRYRLACLTGVSDVGSECNESVGCSLLPALAVVRLPMNSANSETITNLLLMSIPECAVVVIAGLGWSKGDGVSL